MDDRANAWQRNQYSYLYQLRPQDFTTYCAATHQLYEDRQQARAEAYLGSSKLSAKEQKEYLVSSKWSNDERRQYNNLSYEEQEKRLANVRLPYVGQQVPRSSVAYHHSDKYWQYPVEVHDPALGQKENETQQKSTEAQILTSGQRWQLHEELHGNRVDCRCFAVAAQSRSASQAAQRGGYTWYPSTSGVAKGAYYRS